MPFTKLDERILQSSIMAEDSDTFKIFIILLAACKEDGIAEVSDIYISSISHIPLSTVVNSLKKLEDIDPHSRSLNDDGRRIKRVDGGFEIINYLKYREYSLRSAEAERKRLYRQRKKCPDNSGHCPDTSSSYSFSNSEEGGVGGEGSKPEPREPPALPEPGEVTEICKAIIKDVNERVKKNTFKKRV